MTRPEEAPTTIVAAARVLRAGGLVAFPTETVYGLGAIATDEVAVGRIFAVKGRPPTHPLIVHAATAPAALRWARNVDERGERLAAAFWPGPLTLVLERHADLPAAVTGGADTVALRVPAHPIASALLHEVGAPVAAPSANRFGQVSPTRAEDVRRSLGDAVDLVLDGGSCDVGVESTIVSLVGPEPVLLRPGGLEAERIEELLGTTLRAPGRDAPAAPGTLASHYAPRCRVEIVEPDEATSRRAALEAEGERVATMLPSTSLEDDARTLYRRLLDADDEGIDVIVAVAPEPVGLGRAIADRLRRAAAPRPVTAGAAGEP